MLESKLLAPVSFGQSFDAGFSAKPTTDQCYRSVSKLVEAYLARHDIGLDPQQAGARSAINLLP
jgi:hypothetical protein